MSEICPAVADGAFLQSVLAFVDCQAQAIGAEGYRALAAAGSPFSLMLTGLLTIFIALFGYRMLFGDTPGLRESVLAVVKVGIVLALATSWPAYRTLVYDVTFHGPTDLFARVGGPAQLPASDGGMIDRLGQVDAALLAIGRYNPPPSAALPSATGQPVAVTAPEADLPSMFSPYSLGTARIVYLTATIASFATVRIVAGLLLAMGPFFIGSLLFEGTRSLFEGWLRGLVAAAMGALAVTTLLAVELALLEPWLTTLLARRMAGLPIGGASTELLVVMFAFGLALAGGLAAAARISFVRLPRAVRAVPAEIVAMLGQARANTQPVTARAASPAATLSRAAAVAEAVAHVQRRESAAASAGGTSRIPVQALGRDVPVAATAPLGQSYRRRTVGRVSASAGRRDSRS